MNDSPESIEALKTILVTGIAAKIRSFDSQRAAAEAIDIQEATVSRIVNGQTERFSVAALVALAERFGCKINLTVT